MIKIMLLKTEFKFDYYIFKRHSGFGCLEYIRILIYSKHPNPDLDSTFWKYRIRTAVREAS